MTPAYQHRIRVISDNDYEGDPDGLVQLAHLILSPSVQVAGVISSHLRKDGFWPIPEDSAKAGWQKATRVVELAGRAGHFPVVCGSETAMPDLATIADSPAVDLIVHEAMREDTDLPLYVVCGAGLTSVASAYLREPRIAGRLTVVWIGGHEYGTGSVENAEVEPEYNSLADLTATQLVFNHSPLAIWQVPRDVYRQTMVSRAELEERMVSVGALGAYIWQVYQHVEDFLATLGVAFGEIYIMGDSPLVLLTALQVGMDSQPVTGKSQSRPAPAFDENGKYSGLAVGLGARSIRVFETIDNRLMMEDFFHKLQKLARTSLR